MSFTPGIGNTLTIAAGGGASGALITDFLSPGLCGGDCPIVGGFLTMTSGPETSGMTAGGVFSYTFGSGGSIDISGEIPALGINALTTLFTATTSTGSTFSGAGSVGTFSSGIDLASISLAPQLGSFIFTAGSSLEDSFSVSSSCDTGGSCTGSIIKSTEVLTAAAAVPEPTTITLLAAVLFAVGAAGRMNTRGSERSSGHHALLRRVSK